jgi:acyl-CoA dehydrogenase
MITFAFATFVIVIALAALRAPIFVWTAAVGLAGAAWATVLGLGAAVNIVLASAFFVVAAALNLPALRRRVLSDPVLALYRRILPDMSQTEQEALDAGTVWWDGELFSGNPGGRSCWRFRSRP